MAEYNFQDIENISETHRSFNLLLSVGVFSFLIWASLYPLDIISLAQGTITPASNVQAIQHLEGGIIEEIKVEEGDKVKAGQELAVLQSIASGSDYGELFTRVQSLRADLIRLEAEASETEEPFYAEIEPEIAQKSMSLFTARQENLRSNRDAKLAEVTQRKQDIQEITARLRNTRSRFQFAEEQVRIGKDLLAEGLSNRYEQLDRLKEASTLQSSIEEDEASLVRAKAARDAAMHALEALKTGFQQDVAKELSETRQHYSEASQRLAKYQDNFQRAHLRAPKDGVVKAIYVSTRGAVLKPGDTVMDLVPEGDLLVIEGQLPPQDIGHVQVAQKAFIQLASNDASRFGRVEGRVIHIGADTLQTEEGEPYYVVRIEPNQIYFKSAEKKYNMIPGVLVSAGIITGQRSVLEYIFSPLLQTMPFALGEL